MLRSVESALDDHEYTLHPLNILSIWLVIKLDLYAFSWYWEHSTNSTIVSMFQHSTTHASVWLLTRQSKSSQSASPMAQLPSSSTLVLVYFICAHNFMNFWSKRLEHSTKHFSYFCIREEVYLTRLRELIKVIGHINLYNFAQLHSPSSWCTITS